MKVQYFFLEEQINKKTRIITVFLLIIFSSYTPYYAYAAPPTASLSLTEALAAAYRSNPQILREQAHLRQIDEAMPQALSGWRPTVTVNSTANYNESNYVTYPYGGAFRYNQTFKAPGYAAGVTIDEPLFRGGKTWASMKKARSSILEERAHLTEVEQQLFQDVISAYVTLLQARSLLALTQENERTLAGQVHLTTRQLALNQATRTDALQAESQYNAAQAITRQSEGQLRIAEATFQRVIGIVPPEQLAPPTPWQSPLTSLQQVEQAALTSLPQVIQAQYRLESARHDVQLATAELLPRISAQASYQRQINQGSAKFSQNAKAFSLQASMPLYQGGGEYSRIRSAKQALTMAQHNLDDQKRMARQFAISSWQKLRADKDQLTRNKKAVSIGVQALHAIQRQELLGVRTTFEVLQQQGLLFEKQKSLIENKANLIEDSYRLAAAIGRLTAKDLHLPVQLYSPQDHYRDVKWKLIGLK